MSNDHGEIIPLWASARMHIFCRSCLIKLNLRKLLKTYKAFVITIGKDVGFEAFDVIFTCFDPVDFPLNFVELPDL